MISKKVHRHWLRVFERLLASRNPMIRVVTRTVRTYLLSVLRKHALSFLMKKGVLMMYDVSDSTVSVSICLEKFCYLFQLSLCSRSRRRIEPSRLSPVSCLLRIYYAQLTIFKIGSTAMMLLCITHFWDNGHRKVYTIHCTVHWIYLEQSIWWYAMRCFASVFGDFNCRLSSSSFLHRVSDDFYMIGQW